jgi:hypothetical protein
MRWRSDSHLSQLSPLHICVKYNLLGEWHGSPSARLHSSINIPINAKRTQTPNKPSILLRSHSSLYMLYGFDPRCRIHTMQGPTPDRVCYTPPSRFPRQSGPYVRYVAHCRPLLAQLSHGFSCFELDVITGTRLMITSSRRTT